MCLYAERLPLAGNGSPSGTWLALYAAVATGCVTLSGRDRAGTAVATGATPPDGSGTTKIFVDCARFPARGVLRKPPFVIEFNGIAVSRRIKDDSTGQWKDVETNFFNVTAWRGLAENVAESLTQGSRVVVVGRLRTNQWETQEGEKRSTIEIEAEEVGPSLKWATAKIEKQGGGFGRGDWQSAVTVGAGGPQEETPI